MTERVVDARPEHAVAECLVLMTHRRLRHRPLIDGEHLPGVLSIGDLVTETISEREFLVRRFESDIHG